MKFYQNMLSQEDLSINVSKSLRIKEHDEILSSVLKLRNRLGITRIADLMEYDHVGIPVYATTRPQVSRHQITTSQGKGLTKTESLLSALMEAVERYCASVNQNTIIASQDELTNEKKEKFLPIIKLGILDNLEYEKIDWVQSKDIISADTIYIPAAEVYFPFEPSPGCKRPVRPSTTGLSSGNTIGEAALHALFEVCERDTVSRFSSDICQANFLPHDNIKDDGVQEILAIYKKARIEVLICDLSHMMVIPVYYVALFSEDYIGPPMVTAGQGAHLYPEIALYRALLEAAQCRIVGLQGSREDLVRHSSNYASSWSEVKKKFRLICKTFKQKPKTSLQTTAKNWKTIADAWKEMITRFKSMDLEQILVTNLTNEKLGIAVVHVCVPGLIDTIVDPNRKRLRKGSA